MTKQSGNKGVYRIIGGQWKGKKIHFVATRGLRPTTDRVRETLFNWLMFDINGARCLDCFSGSGAVGFEALSRGAKHLDCFEDNKLAVRKLKENLQQLGSQQCIIHQTDTLQRLIHAPNEAYDIVFIDPPFRQQMLQQTLDLLEDNDWVQQGSLIYLEAEKELPDIAIPGNWKKIKEKFAGQVAYRLFEVQN